MKPSSIFAGGNQITTIDGVQGQVLMDLVLNNNAVADISPLRSCVIKKNLQLMANPTSDLSPLEGQPLHHLFISETNITDLTPLRTMKNLAVLKISGPPPDTKPASKTWHTTPDLKTIGALKIKQLELANAGITSIDPLNSCEITDYLNLSNNSISDLSALKGLQIKRVNLSNTDVADLTPLKKMTEMEELDLAINLPGKKGRLTSLAGLAGLSIRHLDLSGQPISDIAPLQALPKLNSLEVSGSFEDLSPLKNLPLQNVRIREARITDLSVIRSLKNLRNLAITGSQTNPGALENVIPLAGRTFYNLILDNNKIEDVRPLAYCKVEGGLVLANNPLQDISSLEDQPLWYLDISNTKVTDITVIRTMKQLRRLQIKGLTLDEKSEALLSSIPITVIRE